MTEYELIDLLQSAYEKMGQIAEPHQGKVAPHLSPLRCDLRWPIQRPGAREAANGRYRLLPDLWAKIWCTSTFITRVDRLNGVSCYKGRCNRRIIIN